MPSIAPFVSAWRRRMASLPGPVAGTGEASNGDPLQVELLISGVWTDITSYVMTRDGSEQVRITRGQRDQGARVEQSTCHFQLNNRDGRFSRKNPTSPYYGQLGRNQQMRVSVPGPTGGKLYRFWGEISKWPTKWDLTGTDVWVECEATGILQRLAQGSVPKRSLVYTGVTEPPLSSLVAYWPCEDVESSTTLASALTNGSPMTFTGSPTLAAYSGFRASDPLPELPSSALSGGVTRYDDPTATQVRFLCHIPAAGLSDGKVICAIDQVEASAGAPAFWELYYTTVGSTLVLRQCASDGALLGIELTHTLDVRGRHMRISVEFEEDGTSLDRAIRIMDLGTMTTDSVTDTAAVSSVQRVTGVQFGVASRSAVGPFGTLGLTGVAVGHVTVQSAVTATTDLGVRLDPSGEAAGRRVERICAEKGIPFDAVGSLDDTVAMGGQSRQKPIDVMREAETADDGMLFENLAVFGLGYRTRESLNNQDPAITLSYPGSDLSEVPEPVEDDQPRNLITVTNSTTGNSEVAELTTGAMSTADPPVGIGEYGDPVDLNLQDDSTLADQANWRLHIATADDSRYPQITVNLARNQIVGNPALRAQALSVRPGDRLLITDPPAWLPPDDISQLVLGMNETIDHFQHTVTFICAPESPWRVGFLDDAVYGRTDTDGSTVYAAATSGATSLDVTRTGSGGLWTTAAADFPFDISAGGETMTVTSIASKESDTFTRVESNGWGTSSGGGAWSIDGGAASDRSVSGTQGVVTLATSPSTIRFQYLPSDLTDCEILTKVSVDQLATGQALIAAILFRYVSSSSFYRARMHFETSGGLAIAVTRDTTQIGTAFTLPYTYAANDQFYLRAKLTGHRIQVKAWPVSTVGWGEPKDWQTEQTITNSAIASGMAGTAASAFAGNTNVSPAISFDDFEILDPQKFTVTRSVNDVVKAQTAGTDLRLAHPTIIAL